MFGILSHQIKVALAFAVPAAITAGAELLDAITRNRREREEARQINSLLEENSFHTVAIGDVVMSHGTRAEAQEIIEEFEAEDEEEDEE